MINQYKRILFSLFIIQILCLPIVYGEDIIRNQFWLDYNPSWVIGHKISLYSDFGARTDLPTTGYRYNARIGVNYKPFILSDRHTIIKNMQFHGGFGDFYSYSVDDENINEFRIMQGVRVYGPLLKRVRFSHFVRFEERFENKNSNETKIFSARMRYLLGAKFQFRNEKLMNLYFPCSVEFFMPINAGISFNDVVRITPAIGYNFTDQLRTELNVSYHYGRNSPEDSFENNDLVFRLRVFQVF